MAFGLLACQTTASVEQQTRALTSQKQSVATRQIQSRRFDTGDETKILAACAGLLQDLGFITTESSARAGLLVASKDRSTADPGKKFFAVSGAQRIRISIVTTPVNAKTVIVRATFQRIFYNPYSPFTRVESINDPLIYQDFFNKLSQSVFLEAHKI